MKSRMISIDIFRAITMLLMIVVNDLWTLHNIPGWLEHTEAHEDGMGLADAVFPAFLFIVGLSIPFAVKARLNKGDSRFTIMLHIIRRGIALLIMGFFMVNQEGIMAGTSALYKDLWQVFMIVGFILIWNNYTEKKFYGLPVWLLQTSGICLLLILAWKYQGGTPENPQWMKVHWWGILGIIGWAYLLCSLVFILSRNRWSVLLIAFLGLLILNLFEFLPLTKNLPGPLLMVSASGHALVMGGVLASRAYQDVKDGWQKLLFPSLLLSGALLLIIYGFAVRPFWGISKIMATPAWTAICLGISMSCFALLYGISDILQFSRWANPIMPAGRSTLTCYLLPVVLYPVLWPLQQYFPQWMLTGGLGLLKSLLFTLLVIFLTGMLEKLRIIIKI